MSKYNGGYVGKHIYSPWAFTEDENLKKQSNLDIYNELKAKYTVNIINDPYFSDPEVLSEVCVVARYKHGYASDEYLILSNPDGLTYDQIALLCDEGNLCYGHHMDSWQKLTINTD